MEVCVLFEVVTEYNKDIFCKCYRVYYKVFSKYNTKKTILLMIISFALATIALALRIINPEVFHTVWASVYFYTMFLIFLRSEITMNDRGIRRTVDRVFRKNPDMDLIRKYVFNEENFVSTNDKNETKYYEYSSIVHLEIVDEYIIMLLKSKKFMALKNSDELISFLQTKVGVVI